MKILAMVASQTGNRKLFFLNVWITNGTPSVIQDEQHFSNTVLEIVRGKLNYVLSQALPEDHRIISFWSCFSRVFCCPERSSCSTGYTVT